MKKEIKEILRKHGAYIAEDVSVSVAKGVLKALPEILQATDNKFDDLLIPLISVIEPKILEILDKIDGEEEN